MRMCKSVGTTIAFGLAALLAVNLGTPRPAEAFIDEIIAALCSGEEVRPPGQVNRGPKSFTRALLATGFITSVDSSDPNKVVISFDPTIPNSKFRSLGFDLTLEDEIAPGVDLVLSPGVEPDPDFAAHANCRNFP